MIECGILELNVHCAEGPFAPNQECCSQFTLSLFYELEIVLVYCLFRDLLGTFDTIRYRRSVGVFYCLQKLFVDVLENCGVLGS